METISRHLDAVLAFHLVATEKSFTRAAESLGASKATVSKHLQRLEAALGVQLLLRSTRHVMITPEGQVLLEFSQRIFDLSIEAGHRMRGLQEGDGGVVKLSTPLSFGEVFYPSFLQEARKSLSEVVFDTDLSNELRDFQRDEIDFAIRATDVTEPDLVARYLGKLKDVICCAPSIAKKISGRDPRVLAEADCILSTTEAGWNSWTLVSKKEEIRVQVKGRLATNQYSMVREYALQEYGVARLPHYFVTGDLQSRRLVQLFPDYRIATHPLYLVYRKVSYSSKRQKKVRDEILRWFRQRPEMFI